MPIISISNLSKAYSDGTNALDDVNLEVIEGEIIALLGPNGAGKTTLISAICGLLTYDSGRIKVDGYDTITEYRRTRKLIGLVPQEIMLEPFETVYDRFVLLGECLDTRKIKNFSTISYKNCRFSINGSK